MDERGDRLSAPRDEGRCTHGFLDGQLDGPPHGIDVPLPRRDPVGDLERVTTQGIGKRVPEVGSDRVRSQLDEEVGDRGAGEARVHHRAEERDRNGGVRGEDSGESGIRDRPELLGRHVDGEDEERERPARCLSTKTCLCCIADHSLRSRWVVAGSRLRRRASRVLTEAVLEKREGMFPRRTNLSGEVGAALS